MEKKVETQALLKSRELERYVCKFRMLVLLRSPPEHLEHEVSGNSGHRMVPELSGRRYAWLIECLWAELGDTPESKILGESHC